VVVDRGRQRSESIAVDSNGGAKAEVRINRSRELGNSESS
jgi:hypothetical protein